MRVYKLLVWGAFIALLLGLVSSTLAAGPKQPPAGTAAQEPGPSVAAPSGGQIQSVGNSKLDGVVPGILPIGMPFDLCFNVFAQSYDAEFLEQFWVDLPDGWTVHSVAPNSDPPANGCSDSLPPVSGIGTGNQLFWQSNGYPPSTHCGAWNGSPNGTNFYFCANVTVPDTSGAPWSLPWLYQGDVYGGLPHQTTGTWGPLYAGLGLMPDRIEDWSCACGVQLHDLFLRNNLGTARYLKLSYEVVSGAGYCSGPDSFYLNHGEGEEVAVEVLPGGDPGDATVCEVTVSDAFDPSTSFTATIIQHVEAAGIGNEGWQIKNRAGVVPVYSAGGVVGTHPLASGPVGYLVGGWDVSDSSVSSQLQMYDPFENLWTDLAALPNPRGAMVTGWIDSKLYTAGGFEGGWGSTSDLQVYDPAVNTWDNVTPAELPAVLGGGVGGVGTCADGTGECLFHVGGSPAPSFADATLLTYQYHPGSNLWTQLDDHPPDPTQPGILMGSGTGCLGEIYVGGTWWASHDFYRLDATQPSGSQWTQLADVPAGAGVQMAALVCKEDWNSLLLIGGDPDGWWGTNQRTVYVYDIASDTWAGPMMHELNVAVIGNTAWHLDGRVYSVGGGSNWNPDTPMPFESLRQVPCDPDACRWLLAGHKAAPFYAVTGETFPYTITIAPAIATAISLIDELPPGLEYAGNLSASTGTAWYHAGTNSVQWSYTPAPPRPAPGPARTSPALPGEALDLAGPAGEVYGPVPAAQPAAYRAPEAVLYDNGPLVNEPAACAGMDASRLQMSLGMGVYGFGHQYLSNNRVADDFRVAAPFGWQIDTITFFAYQTGEPSAPSPITGVYYQIWDGAPFDPASSVVFGDLTTNRLASSTFTGIQRDTEGGECLNNRFIFANVASAGVNLPPGDYWVEWYTDGTGLSGPWAPPVTINGSVKTGNAWQYLSSTGAWGPVVDGGAGAQQDFPFIINGEAFEAALITFDVKVTGSCGDVIRNGGTARLAGMESVFTAVTVVNGEALLSAAPAAVEMTVPIGASATAPVEVCAEGDCPLWWMVEELGPAARLAGSTPFVPARVEGAGPAPAGMSVSSPARAAPAARPAAPEAPAAVLWDQPLSAVNTDAYVNQEFPDAPQFSSWLADDFSNAQPWLINSISLPGDGWGMFSTLFKADTITWQIYADNGSGLPAGDPSGGGSPPVWTLTLDPTDYQMQILPGTTSWMTNLQLNPRVPVILPPGDWWLVVYPTAKFAEFGQWGRQSSDTTNGATAQFINPGNGFGFGPNWQAWNLLGVAQTDMAFRLEGVEAPAVGNLPWLSAVPNTGTVSGGMCQVFNVNVNAASLAVGVHNGELVLFSNDLTQPVVNLPVQVTVAYRTLFMPLIMMDR